jgi:hypothetical protein
MSGGTEVRTYRKTVDEVPLEYTNVTTAVLNSSTKNHAIGVKRYVDGVATVGGLDSETTYYFLVELIDVRDNKSGPQSIGSHTSDSPPPLAVWEFFAKVSTFGLQNINSFSYTGEGPYV